MKLSGRSPDASVTLPFVPRSVLSGSRGHRHPSACDSRVFLLTGFEPGACGSGVRCMTAEQRDFFFSPNMGCVCVCVCRRGGGGHTLVSAVMSFCCSCRPNMRCADV